MAYLDFYEFAFNYIKSKLVKFQTEKPIEFDMFKTKYNIEFNNIDTFVIPPGGMFDRPSKIFNYISFTSGFDFPKTIITIMLIEKEEWGGKQVIMNMNGSKALLLVEGNRKSRCIFDWYYWNSPTQKQLIVKELQYDKNHIKHILKTMFDFNYLRKTSNFHLYGFNKEWERQWKYKHQK